MKTNKSYNFEIHYKNNTVGILEDINPAVAFLSIRNKVLATIEKINIICVIKDSDNNIISKSKQGRAF